MRRPDWRECLVRYLAASARRSLRPGQHDCVIWAAGAREAMTGEDLTSAVRGAYNTIQEGLELARSMGWPEPWMAVVSGLEEVPPAFAQVGDIALLDGDDGLPAMGVVQGALIYVLGLRGTNLVPMTSARRVWRV